MSDLVKISDLFDIVYGVNLELVKLKQCKSTDKNSMIFVSRTEKNNGVSAYVEVEDSIKPNQAHTLSVAAGGSVLATFYQPLPYYSGRDLYVLIPKKKMSEVEMFFYATSIRKNKYKYNYGRQANKTLKDILIPSKIPDELNKHLLPFKRSELNKISSEKIIDAVIDLKALQWKPFNLNELFDIKGSKTTSILELKKYGNGKYPYVTTQATNNGTEGLYDFYTEEGNVITTDSAVLGYCSYQKLPFSASDHVEKLIPKFEMNEYTAVFLITILNLEQYKYNYGRKCSQKRIKKSVIQLPINEKGNPNWKFMEAYVKSLAYSSSLKSII